jgi:hypothetical protein
VNPLFRFRDAPPSENGIEEVDEGLYVLGPRSVLAFRQVQPQVLLAVVQPVNVQRRFVCLLESQRIRGGFCVARVHHHSARRHHCDQRVLVHRQFVLTPAKNRRRG